MINNYKQHFSKYKYLVLWTLAIMNKTRSKPDSVDYSHEYFPRSNIPGYESLATTTPCLVMQTQAKVSFKFVQFVYLISRHTGALKSAIITPEFFFLSFFFANRTTPVSFLTNSFIVVHFVESHFCNLRVVVLHTCHVVFKVFFIHLLQICHILLKIFEFLADT